ncbi:hypothetical protein NMG60_11025977 [Bertholletia excelsa]
MAPEQHTTTDGEKRTQFDRDIREMVSDLTSRLTDLQHIQKQTGSSHHLRRHGHDEEDEDRGVRIITLAGNNTGATMRGLEEKTSGGGSQDQGLDGDEMEAVGTYVNSNFQGINNSILMGGSYSANDPGVHMDVTDYVDNPDQDGPGKHGKKKAKGKKKKEKVGSNNGDKSSSSSTD